MTRFYCPGCWEDFAEDLDPCPHCGLNIQSFWDSLDRVDKLVVALEHREPSTRLRAAWPPGPASRRNREPADRAASRVEV